MYRLSDLFHQKEEMPELELKVTVFNINPGCNTELLEKCESLHGYITFVGKVRDKRSAGTALEASVSQAVEECISEGILAGFFREHREEIVEMGIYEFDQEFHDRVLREDGEAIGMEKGMAIGVCIYQKIQAGEADDRTIAEACGCRGEDVEAVRRQLEDSEVKK